MLEAELDIGFGLGASLIERAQQVPGTSIVGMEVRRKHALQVQQRCEALGLKNVQVLVGDAKQLLMDMQPDGCLSRVSLHFPDPWWKKRHHKRRVINAQTLCDIARLLRPGGQLLVQTDVEPLAKLYQGLIAATEGLVLRGDNGWMPHNPFGAPSNRERRAALDGLPVWRLLAERLA